MATQIDFEELPDEQAAPAAPFQLAALTPHIRATEAKYGLPSGLLDRMIQKESGGNPDAVSPKGALGLLQIMPATAKELGVDPRDPAQAVEGAAKYLARLNKNYGGDWNKTLAAYNWGPGNLANYGMDKMPAETRDYVAKLSPQGAAARPEPKMPAAETPPQIDFEEEAAPAPQTGPESLSALQERRAQLEAKDEALRVQEMQLTRAMKRGNSPTASPETRAQAAVAGRALEQIQILRAQLKQEIDRTGVGSTFRKAGSLGGAVVGGVGGGLAGGVPGGIAGSALGTILGSAGGSAIDVALAKRNAQELDEAEVAKMVSSGVLEDLVWDVGGNLLLIGGGKVLGYLRSTPQAKAFLQRAQHLAALKGRTDVAQKMAAAARGAVMDPTNMTPGAHQLDDVATTEARAKAVDELGRVSGGALPTKGQITGSAGLAEQATRVAEQEVFDQQAKQLQRGADLMRTEVVAPHGQPSAVAIGTKVTDAASALEQKVKADTKQVFIDAGKILDPATGAPVLVRRGDYLKAIQTELDRVAASGGAYLKPGEQEWLAKHMADLQRVPGLTPEGALDVISSLKARARDLDQAGGMSTQFENVVRRLVSVMDDSYEQAARRTGNRKAHGDLMQARDLYREMAETAFSDDIRRALRANPEDVGRLFWQKGNVSEPEALDRLLSMSVRTKAMTQVEADRLTDAVRRGFLQEAVPTVEAAANWTKSLQDPAKRRTWEALTKGKGGAELTQTMRVLEQAAKVAKTETADLIRDTNPATVLARRAAGGTVGVGITTGSILLKMVGAGMSISAYTKLAAKAAASSNKGILRDLQLIASVGTRAGAAGVAPVRAAMSRVAQFAAESGEENPFTEEQQ